VRPKKAPKKTQRRARAVDNGRWLRWRAAVHDNCDTSRDHAGLTPRSGFVQRVPAAGGACTLDRATPTASAGWRLRSPGHETGGRRRGVSFPGFFKGAQNWKRRGFKNPGLSAACSGPVRPIAGPRANRFSTEMPRDAAVCHPVGNGVYEARLPTPEEEPK